MPPPCVGGTSRASGLCRSQKVNPGGVARQTGTSSDPQCQVSVTAKMSRLRSRIVFPRKANLFDRDLAFQTAARRPDEDGTDDVGEGEDVDVRSPTSPAPASCTSVTSAASDPCLTLKLPPPVPPPSSIRN